MALIVTPAIYDPLMTCLSYGTQMATLPVGLDAIEEVFSVDTMQHESEKIAFENMDIKFESVSFSYQTSEEDRIFAIKNISFIAEQGKMTALVGESGGGKSTMGQLISRFYDVNDGEGNIYIGGVEIKKIPYDTLMNSISYVL